MHLCILKVLLCCCVIYENCCVEFRYGSLCYILSSTSASVKHHRSNKLTSSLYSFNVLYFDITKSLIVN